MTSPTTKACPTFYLFTYEKTLIPVRCGSWSCPSCRRRLAARWSMRTYDQIEAWGGECYFWTLTLWGSVRSPEAGYARLPGLWDNLRKIVQRGVGQFTYAAFVEGQPKREAMPHFHVILATTPYGMRLKDMAVQAGFGYQAKQEIVVSKLGAFYVTKYVTKSSEVTPKNFRRVRVSRDFARFRESDFEPQAVIARRAHEPIDNYIVRAAGELGIGILAAKMLYDHAAYAEASPTTPD